MLVWSPHYRGQTVLLQVLVAARELMLSKPAAPIGRQRRGMYGFQHQVPLSVYHLALGTGIASPQHINQMLTLCGQGTDGCIRKLLPP